jgi:hypothetical protein
MFKRKKIEVPVILEIESTKRIPPLDANTREAVTSLRSHPGFQYLLGKLRVERAVFESQLRNQRHSNLSDVAYLQAGAFWTNWLEKEVSREIGIIQRNTAVPLSQEELAAFETAKAAYEEIG